MRIVNSAQHGVLPSSSSSFSSPNLISFISVHSYKSLLYSFPPLQDTVLQWRWNFKSLFYAVTIETVPPCRGSAPSRTLHGRFSAESNGRNSVTKTLTVRYPPSPIVKKRELLENDGKYYFYFHFSFPFSSKRTTYSCHRLRNFIVLK